jgi:hypothetical protein
VGIRSHAAELEALRRSVLKTVGATESTLRESAFRGAQLPAPLGSYVSKVHNDSHRISDSDVAGLLAAGYSEDAVFEITLAAAIGAANRRLDAGLGALRAV